MAYKTLFISYTLLLSFGLMFRDKPTVKFNAENNSFSNKENADYINTVTFFRLAEKVEEAKNYVAERGFDEQYCFLIDMRLPSGKNRFFSTILILIGWKLQGLFLME